MVSFDFAPRGWALCNGQLLPINQNQALFSLLGTTFGGNGQTTFALPELRGRVPLHFGQGFTLGQGGGEAAHTLTAAEVPPHAHDVALAATTADASSKFPENQRPAVAPIEMYSRLGTLAPMHPLAATATAGGSQPHTNMQPYLAVNFVIALTGIYPSRT